MKKKISNLINKTENVFLLSGSTQHMLIYVYDIILCILIDVFLPRAMKIQMIIINNNGTKIHC